MAPCLQTLPSHLNVAGNACSAGGVLQNIAKHRRCTVPGKHKDEHQAAMIPIDSSTLKRQISKPKEGPGYWMLAHSLARSQPALQSERCWCNALQSYRQEAAHNSASLGCRPRGI